MISKKQPLLIPDKQSMIVSFLPVVRSQYSRNIKKKPIITVKTAFERSNLNKKFNLVW